MIGQILQLATILDNVGIRADLLHEKLIRSTTQLYPRLHWSQWFASVVEKELRLKPWCHTSSFEVGDLLQWT